MALEFMANINCTFTKISSSPAGAIVNVNGFVRTFQQSTKCKTNSINVAHTRITWSVPVGNCRWGAFSNLAGSGSMNCTPSLKTRVEGNYPMRVNDQGNCACVMYLYPAFLVAMSCVIRLTGAGQTKVQCQ
jgi:hypothetical protein